MSDVTRLVLVRHGESRASVDEVVAGHEGCQGLSDLGRLQAAALRDRLAATGELQADVLMASVLPRAVETAEIIAPALGDLEVRQDCDLCELHPGEGDGLPWAEFQARYRPDGVRPDPHEPLAPGAESVAMFQSRVARALTRVADEHEGRTVVVACHGGVVEASLVGFLGLPHFGTLTTFWTRNTALTEWVLRADDKIAGGPHRWRLARYNDAAHLAGLWDRP